MLAVVVDGAHPESGEGERLCRTPRKSGLADPALVIEDCNDSHEDNLINGTQGVGAANT